MAIFYACGKNGAAYCDYCGIRLYYDFDKTNCGRPIAVCSHCKKPYVLDATIFTGDALMDYLDYKTDPVNRKWEWVPFEEFCLKIA